MSKINVHNLRCKNLVRDLVREHHMSQKSNVKSNFDETLWSWRVFPKRWSCPSISTNGPTLCRSIDLGKIKKLLVLPSTITQARKMSLPIHLHSFCHAMFCQFQWRKMLPLSSLTSLLKALTSAMTQICWMASSIYSYPMLQRSTLLISNGYMNNILWY